MTDLPSIVPETPADAAEVDALIAAAFGPGRFVKAVERLRERNHAILDLSAVVRQDGRVVGCARLWPIHIGDRAALLLGPFAVDADYRSSGLGAAMIAWCCDRAEKAGHDLVFLVGDAPYFDKLGFISARNVRLPLPVNVKRMLVKPLKPGAADGLEGDATL